MRAYENESELQAILEASPQLVFDLEERPGVVLREFSLAEAGFLDLLIVHADGDLTLVEAKLNRNPEIRRSVVGQLLGYAGGLWQMTYDDLVSAITARQGRSLLDLMAEAVPDGQFDPDAFRTNLTRNLHEGAFRLVFAVDAITDDLRRAVAYLNAHTVEGTQVVVLELDYSRVDDVEILIPRSFGEEAARTKRTARRLNHWTEQDFRALVDAHEDPAERTVALELLEWAQPRVARFYWGEGQSPSCTMVFDVPEGEIQPCAIYAGAQGLSVAINFEWMRKRPRAAVNEVLERLRSLPTIARSADGVVAAGFAKRPGVPAAEVAAHGSHVIVDALTALLEAPATAPEHR